jgi:hypothetical protein
MPHGAFRMQTQASTNLYWPHGILDDGCVALLIPAGPTLKGLCHQRQESDGSSVLLKVLVRTRNACYFKFVIVLV